MANNEGRGKTYAIFLFGILCLAFTAPWVKLSNFEPATSVFLRCGLGLLALLPFMVREIKKHGAINKSQIILSLVAGLFLGIDFTAWNYSIYYAGSGIASVLLNLQIIILPALVFLFDKEKLPRTFFIVAPIMIVGVLMTGGIFDGGATATDGPTEVYGMNIAVLGTLAGSISGICYGFYLYFARKSSSGNINQIVQPMAYATLSQIFIPLIFMLIRGEGFDFVNGVLASGALPMNPETTPGDPINATNWLWVIVLATLGQAVCWTFVQYGSVRLDSTIVSGLLLLSPISTVAIIAVVLFGEIPSTLQIIGVVLVIGAVAYQNGLFNFLKKAQPDFSSLNMNQAIEGDLAFDRFFILTQ